MVDQVASLGQMMNPALQGMMTPPQQSNTLNNGTLVTFQYKFFKTDPYPLVILARVEQGELIKGVNLHYLTFNYIKNVLQAHAGNSSFSWQHHVKLDNYLSNAYRHYKWSGIAMQTFRILDAQLIVKVANMVRSIDPNEVRAIKQSIREQMQQQMNITADQLSGEQVQTPAFTPQQVPQVQQVPTVPGAQQQQQPVNQNTTEAM